MKKILVFGASNSAQSINKQLAHYTAQQIPEANITLLDLNDFEMPIYSPDRESEHGIHENAQVFKQHILDSDGILISFAEYNGSFTAAFKNIYDRISRLGKPIWGNKPMFLMATSPGVRGGTTVLDHALVTFPHRGGEIVASFSLPSFYENFSIEQGVTDPSLYEEHSKQLALFAKRV